MSKTLRDVLIILFVTIASTVAVWWMAGLDTVKQNFDGPYYAVVARSLYNQDVIRTYFSFPLPLEYYPAHFPLYPILMRTLNEFFGIPYLDAGLAINLIATVACAITLYIASKHFKLAHPLAISLAWLFIWPRIWAVRSIASPETLFILFVVLSLLLFEKSKYFLASVVGVAAVLTKSPGILLFVAYSLHFAVNYIKTKKINWGFIYTLLIPASLVVLFGYYYLQTGDFWAYFHSGDNIHLQLLPFRVFDSNQPWVGDIWLEDIWWIYLVGATGVWWAFKKTFAWGWFGLVFYLSILFVSHRDISRYALPLVPVVLIGLSDVFKHKEVRWILALLVIPAFFYTINFISHNVVAISDWTPFL